MQPGRVAADGHADVIIAAGRPLRQSRIFERQTTTRDGQAADAIDAPQFGGRNELRRIEVGDLGGDMRSPAGRVECRHRRERRAARKHRVFERGLPDAEPGDAAHPGDGDRINH